LALRKQGDNGDFDIEFRYDRLRRLVLMLAIATIISRCPDQEQALFLICRTTPMSPVALPDFGLLRSAMAQRRAERLRIL
jgi:hypothetical protein